MRIHISNNTTNAEFKIIQSATRGCIIDFLQGERVEENIMNLIDIIILSKGEIIVKVDDETIETAKIDLETLKSIMESYEHSVEFINRGIYTIMQYIMKCCNSDHELSNGLAFKRYHWQDYIKGDIVHIPESESLFQILRKNSIYIEDIMKYGPVNAIMIFKKQVIEEYIDIESILKRFTIDGIPLFCDDVTYSKGLQRLSIVGVSKIFRYLPGDSIRFSVEHEHMGREFNKRIKSFNIDEYTRSIVINLED